MGGLRQGRPGASYANRADLQNGPRTAPAQPVRTATGQPYGAATQQAQAQTALPLPDLSKMNLSLTRPTERPNEPVTAGIPAGPGPGPEALGNVPVSQVSGDPTVEVLQGLYRIYQNDDLRGMIEQASNVSP